MGERVVKCPQCHAPLAPSRFARSIVCSYCGATVQLEPSSVATARYREAYLRWNNPATHGYGPPLCTIGEAHWKVGEHIGSGEISDVYLAERARHPTELAVLKVLRSEENQDLFDNEWTVLTRLQSSFAPGAANLSLRVPQPIQRGIIGGGAHVGKRAIVLRRAHGFRHTLEGVRNAYRSGIDPRAATWVWRRLLEILSFVHKTGLVHAAVLPRHILIEDGEHGARLVGFSCARPESQLLAVVSGFEDFYSQRGKNKPMRIEDDLCMAARCVSWAVGGAPDGTGLKGRVPPPLDEFLARNASGAILEKDRSDAWEHRQQIGHLAREAFGPPSFHPIKMPA